MVNDLLSTLNFIFNVLWISKLLPSNLIQKLGPLSLVIVGYLVEKKFIGRTSIFSNTIAVNVHVFYVNNAPWFLVLYANMGLLMGFIALMAYAEFKSLQAWFYNASWLYSSVVVGLIILFTG
jgi:hypothetical protein